HCMHCHGSTGAGDGPTAKYLHPLPRDYRLGKYKFISTGSPDGLPSRNDLTRILREGIPGTYMPSFYPALGEREMASVVEYIRWLSMQGQYAEGITSEAAFVYGEEAVAERLAAEEGLTREDIVQELIDYWPDDVTGKLSFVGSMIAENWQAVENEPPVTPAEPQPELEGDELAASIERGKAIYLQKSTQCASCHGARGVGNGSQTVSVLIDAATGEPYDEAGVHDVWGNVVRPRNLTRGIYRGGRRPIDLYRRVYAGIPGSNMPGFGGNLSDEQIWDLVHFLIALPLDPSLLNDATLEEAEPSAVAALEQADRS
ncbi:MAG: cytochrome c, partial [Planctomycetota bacterium]